MTQDTVDWLRERSGEYYARLSKETRGWRRFVPFAGRDALARWTHTLVLLGRAESELHAQEERPRTLRLLQGGRS